MPNLSQLKRQRMLAFLDKIKEEYKTDDEMLIALGEIANALISKKVRTCMGAARRKGRCCYANQHSRI